MMDLFSNGAVIKSDQPLSYRMRPTRLEDFVGQEHILGKDKLLHRLIETDTIGSIILSGPPGSGKTTLAFIIAEVTHRLFVSISAVTANTHDVKKIIEQAKYDYSHNKKTILFIDEIHRFNKAQQDLLLPFLEDGVIGLIGVTTENPFFSLNAPLLSRSQLFRLMSLSTDELLVIMKKALTNKENGLGDYQIDCSLEVLTVLARLSEGDARKALKALEIACTSTVPLKNGLRVITQSIIEEAIQRKVVLYDKKGDEHYDTISAFIKSMRGSDPDATLYWLAKMIEAGEDILFIARRIVICASEDIGNADPQALVIASACAESVKIVGLPEARILLAQTALYLACAPKSNASYNPGKREFLITVYS
ncbi:replication-associated recombination protein A [Chlamydiota bacterium]